MRRQLDEHPCCGSIVGPDQSTEVDADHWRAVKSVTPAPETVRAAFREGLVPLSGGFFDMGTRRSRFPDDYDSPRRRIKLSPFRIAPCAVTNAEFAQFIEMTGYRTVAERLGWSYVFWLFLEGHARNSPSPPGLSWWRAVDGAMWRAPEGPGSTVLGRESHPVVHVAWYDALAYCRWAGLVLPSEAQWEFAARGGLDRKRFPWGNSMMPKAEYAMNTWQGDFPQKNTGEDGFIGTAPVDTYPPNGYGLFNMTGNTWEWVADIFGPPEGSATRPEVDPSGPAEGYARVARGGSYLCHESYCDRYHVHSRTRNDPDSSTGHTGFRVASATAPGRAHLGGNAPGEVRT